MKEMDGGEGRGGTGGEQEEARGENGQDLEREELQCAGVDVRVCVQWEGGGEGVSSEAEAAG
eukprot:3410010-Rhodomonas_salina.1